LTNGELAVDWQSQLGSWHGPDAAQLKGTDMLYQSQNFEVERHFGGLILRDMNRDEGDDVFFQAGDDAAEFEEQLGAFERGFSQGINVPEHVFFGEYF
jgi:hypothetical protein